MERRLFSEDHEIFRQSFRKFVEKEVLPNQERWRENGIVDRETWKKAGESGFLCAWLPEEYGGAGGDFLHSVIIIEELGRAYESGFAMSLHSDVVVPYLASFANEAQKKRWLPGCASGDLITAVAMTEPGTGSDLAAITTTAKRDGDHYVIDGSKTFISNGHLCDLVVVAAKTENAPGDAHRSVTLFVVEATTPGFVRGKRLKKIGMKSQDTAELHFENCRIPAANRLGEEGSGFIMLMQKLAQERLSVALGAQAAAEKVLADTIDYVKERKAFGKAIASFQNTQFVLAECATELEIGRIYLDELTRTHASGKDLVKECSMAKWWYSDMQGRVVDRCLQLFGGYGFMEEYPIARAYQDARVQRIYAGTNEIMKMIIAKQIGL